jgi:hypothetical protein
MTPARGGTVSGVTSPDGEVSAQALLPYALLFLPGRNFPTERSGHWSFCKAAPPKRRRLHLSPIMSGCFDYIFFIEKPVESLRPSEPITSRNRKR